MAKILNGVLVSVDENDVKKLNSGESWADVFGIGITRIGAKAFYNCKSLKRLPELPKEIESIGTMAFWNCTNLTEVCSFPSGLKTIGKQSFYFCTGLNVLPDFPKGLQAIKDGAFFGCTGLTEVNFSHIYASIEDNAFSGCTFLYAVLKNDGQIILSNNQVTNEDGDFVVSASCFEVFTIKKDKDNSPILCVNDGNGNINIVTKNRAYKTRCSIETYYALKDRDLLDSYISMLQFCNKSNRSQIGVEVMSVINGNMALAEKFFKSRHTGYDNLIKKEFYKGISNESKYCIMKLFVSLGGFESSGQKKALKVFDGLYKAYGNDFYANIVRMFLRVPKGDDHLYGLYYEDRHHCFSNSITDFFIKNEENYNTGIFKMTIGKVVSDYPMIYQAYKNKLRDLNPESAVATEPNIEKYKKQLSEGITCEFVLQYMQVNRFKYLSNRELANTLSSLPKGIIVNEKQAKLYEKLLEVEIPKIIDSVKSGQRERNKIFINEIDDGVAVIDDNQNGVHYEWAEINKINALTCGEFMQTCFRPNRANRFAFWCCLDKPDDTFMMLYDGSRMVGYCRVRYYADEKCIMVDNIELSKCCGISFTQEKNIELAHRCKKGLLDMAKAMNEKGFRVDRVYSKQDKYADKIILKEWKNTHFTVDQVKNAYPLEEIDYTSKRERGAYHSENDGPQIILYDTDLQCPKKLIKGIIR